MKTTIIYETINCNESEILEVDPVILMEMRERLNPSKPFSYAKNDHVKRAYEDEKRMREYDNDQY